MEKLFVNKFNCGLKYFYNKKNVNLYSNKLIYLENNVCIGKI